MPADIHFLSIDDVVGIHARLIEEFGGSSGIRDKGLLDSAVHRPQSGYYEDIVEMAAALLHSLLMNHAFVDGNKRTAIIATDVFLALNGQRLKIEAAASEAFLLHQIETAKGDLLPIANWIRQHLVLVK